MITSLGLNTFLRSKKKVKSSYTISNVSMKDILNIIKEFDKLPYKGYVRERPKHEPTNSYFHTAKQLDKCLMRDDAFNSRVDPVRTEITGTKHIWTSLVCDLEER